ncbi:helix-turn-helix domain-containing protein [Sphingomonas sp. CFBP 13720]|uniref:helix-turn-helix domain-containing protein n=1 Tax=Sphingomonas sp. CFBP 13720 TaxID=2775302 RepID=UPI00406C50A6
MAGWRQSRKTSIRQTAKHFGISEATVKRYCRDYGEAAIAGREAWKREKKMREWDREIEEGEKRLKSLLFRLQTDEVGLAQNPKLDAGISQISAVLELIPPK